MYVAVSCETRFPETTSQTIAVWSDDPDRMWSALEIHAILVTELASPAPSQPSWSTPECADEHPSHLNALTSIQANTRLQTIKNL